MDPLTKVQVACLLFEGIGRGKSALLHLTVYNSNFGIIEQLFGKGASLKVQDHDGNTLLYCAVRGGYTDTVTLLLGKGATIEAVNQENDTPLIQPQLPVKLE